MTAFSMRIGEAAAGNDYNAAHVTLVIGHRAGPAGTAWATALSTPSAGHVPFVVALRPGVAVKPFTLFVTKSAPASDNHRALLWGAAQAGIAAGVADAVTAGTISTEEYDSDVIIASIWVNEKASDADEVYRNNREATAVALRNGAHNYPTEEAIADARAHIQNGYYTAPD